MKPVQATLYSLGRLLYRQRLLVLLGWAGLMLACLLELALQPNAKVLTESTGATHTEAYRVVELLRDQFGFHLGNNLTLVYRDAPPAKSAGPSAGKPAVATAAAGQLGPELKRRFPQILAVYGFEGKKDSHLRILFFTFRPGFDFVAAEELVLKMRQYLDGWEARTGIHTWLTGNLAFYADISHESESYLSVAELTALGLAFVILVFSFGGLVAALLPIAMGAATMLLLHALLRITGLDSTPMSDILDSLLGLALAIDYSLFIVSRFAEERAAGAPTEQALATTLAYAGKTILVSSLIVLMSIVVLLIPEVTGSRIMARNLLLVVGLSVFNSVLVLPGLLALGEKLLAWPQALTRRIQGWNRYAAWKRFASRVAARPRSSFALALLLLAALIAPVAGMRLWDPVQTLASPQAESMQGYHVLAADGWGGQMVPIYVLVKSRDGSPIESPAGLSYVYDLTRSLAKIPGVAGVQSLTSWNPDFDKQGYLNYYGSLRLMGDLMASESGNLPFISPGGDVHLIQVYPREIMQVGVTRQIADAIRAYAHQHTDYETLTGGVVERARDFTDELYRQTPLMVGIVILSIFALLFVYMRALLLPLKAGVMNFVPILGAFGVLTLIYQYGWFHELLGTPVNGAVTSMIPITLFCIVFGLSMDYEVLILSRISEAYAATGDVKTAVIEGTARSGSVITGAALIFLSVFFPAVFSNSPAVRELGFGMVSAILIDATLVRLLLVPSFILLMGKWNWWNPWQRKH